MRVLLRLVFATLISTFAQLLPAAAQQAKCDPDKPVAESAPNLAVSLKRLANVLHACRGSGTCSSEVSTWFGMTRISGYVVDAGQQDVLIFGSTQKGAPALHLEDFVIALKNARHGYLVSRNGKLYYSDPGVSIDPDPHVLQNLQSIFANSGGTAAKMESAVSRWCEVCRLPQSVRVEGIPFDTHFAKIMVDADYLMKRIADGSSRAPGIEGVSDMAFKRAVDDAAKRNSAGLGWAGMNRFWFYPGANVVIKHPSAIRILRSDVILLDEAQHLARDGRFVGNGQSDPLARKFACSFSKGYAGLAALPQFRIYSELEGLFRWVALARQLVANRAFETAGFSDNTFLDQALVPRVQVERNLAGIANVKKLDREIADGNRRVQVILRLPSCGGVSIEIDTGRAQVLTANREFERFIRTILASRPATNVAAWRIAA